LSFAANFAAKGRLRGLVSFFMVSADALCAPGGAHRPQRRKFAFLRLR